MKLRIRGQSLRLRLSQPDVTALAAAGRLEEAVVFGPAPGQQLGYVIESDPAAAAIGLQYAPGKLTIVLPSDMARVWMASEETTLEARQPVEGAKDLKLILEKDFACRQTRDAAEDAGSFPNPLPDHVC
jgi:hypothetical protein